MVDVVDLTDAAIGVLPRRLLGETTANFRVVHVFVFNRSGHLLLQKLAPGKGDGLARWGSSVAGHVQSGESYEAAARREFAEELGARPPPLREVGKTWLDSAGRRKFIGVFTAVSDGPFKKDSTEALDLVFTPSHDVRSWIKKDERAFTETFRRVLRFLDGENGWR